MKVFESVPKMVHWRIADSPKSLAFEYMEGQSWKSMTWERFGERVRQIACGLHAIGLKKGDRVGILSGTCMAWVEADIGILCAGGAVSTIYPSNTPKECEFIISDSGARFCVAQNMAQVAKLQEERANMPSLDKVIVFEGEPSEDGWVMTWDKLIEDGAAWDAEHEGQYQARADAVEAEDLATLIYTSGTTGRPKGVMLVHDCWCFTAEGVDELAQEFRGDNDKQYLFLPLSHSFGKILEFIAIRTGIPTAIHGDVNYILQGLAEVRPTFMGAVPRVFEKVYNKIVAGAREKGGFAYKVFTWSVEVGREVSQLRMQGKEPGGLLALKYKIATKAVFSKIKAAFGGQLRCFFSGGAPLSKEIAEFFFAADILILEGYGLTETSAASVSNRFTNFRFGSVGMANPGVELKIAEDGEIMMKGRGIMRGYYNMPEASAEALEEDGWFHTGDIGTKDEAGFVKITGRKKELIITAGGKNIAPAKAENLIKAQSPYISQVVMHGDKRNFCVAILTFEEESVVKWAADQGISHSGYADLASKKQVHDLLWEAVAEVNKVLASYETIKYIHLLDHDLSVESGELTPTMKVKRRIVESRYKDTLDAFYSGTLAGMP